MCDKNLLLVSAIEKFPCLYNHNLQEYMKKDATEKAWFEVAYQASLSVAECKEKWRNLRYSLLRSLKPNADGTLKKKYYLHKKMGFIIPFMKPKGTGFTSHFEEEIDDEMAMQDISQEVTSPQQQLFEYEFLDAEPAAKRKRIEQLQTNCDTEISDSRKYFLLSLLPEVNTLTEEQMKSFRRKVLVLLDDITEGSIEYEKNPIKPEPEDNELGEPVFD